MDHPVTHRARARAAGQAGLPFETPPDVPDVIVDITSPIAGRPGDAHEQSSESGGGAPALPAALAAVGPRYYVRHRRARRYLLRVDPDGRVRVTIPRGGSRREADAFVVRHVDWILSQRARVVRPQLSSESRAALRARASAELPPRLCALAEVHGVTGVARITIRDQRTRWGSCGRDGHITLNWRLVLMPDWVRDYVVIHELMHLRRMDHSPAYWVHVAAACPDYLAARRWLRDQGHTLR